MKKIIRKTLDLIDLTLARCLGCSKRPALTILMFHAIFKDDAEQRAGVLEASSGITIGDLEKIIQYFRKWDYQFISSKNIASLENNKNYLMLTFDDGYFNNIQITPLLKKYEIPAVFFITVNNVLQQKSFWWDVAYRKHNELKTSNRKLKQELQKLILMKHDKREDYLKKYFNISDFNPIGDIDRPMTETELKAFASNDSVEIGNHTIDHAVLTNYSSEDMVEQICDAQRILKDICGYEPEIISYPNGNYNYDTIEIVKNAGLKYGVIVTPPGKNYLKNMNPYALNRLSVLGNSPVLKHVISWIRRCRVRKTYVL